jgi:UDP-GlcNAc:undecaprenyl-phosphate/decaprenyl-phosphate GlcNAc-1-phosphate transferase
MIYIYITFGLVGVYLIYSHLAKKFGVVDKPNERSSHSYLAIRGGGIIFPVAAFIWFLVFGFYCLYGVAGLVLIASISFLDDLDSISKKIRIVVHLIAVSLLFVELSFFQTPWYLWIVGYIIMAGWLNAFNFMDGINGMTVFYSIATLSTFLIVSEEIRFVDIDLILFLFISIAIFSFFNVRKKALAFAGDVGSVSMAFILGGIMLTLILDTGKFEYILFFAVYAADSVFTIFHRLIQGKNIFKAHRSHLYQYLSNELEVPHIIVSLVYACIQLCINFITIRLIGKGTMSVDLFVLLALIISLLYLSARVVIILIASTKIAK